MVTTACIEAIVSSGDSDLVEPVRAASQRFVHVLNPRNMHSDLALAACSYAALNPGLLANCELPSVVHLPSGRMVRRPPEYK